MKEKDNQIAPQTKSAKKYKLLNSALLSMQSRDEAFKDKLRNRALTRYVNAYMELYNQTHDSKRINKDQARKELLKEAKEAKENKTDLKQDNTIAQELYRLNSYEILCSAGKCGETGEQSFRALSAQEKEDGKIYFRRGKDSHEEGRYIARETMLLHPKNSNETYYLQTGENGNSLNLIKGFLEEMLANGHHSLVQSKQFSSYKDSLGYPALTDKENEYQLVLTAKNFESWCNKGSIGELILLNAAQKHINTQQPPKTTLTKYIHDLDDEEIKNLLENPNDPNFANNKEKIKEKFKEIKGFLVNKAINIEGLKGLQSICENPDSKDHDKFYSKIYNLLQQDSGRDEGLELDLEAKKVYTTNILSDTTREYKGSGFSGTIKDYASKVGSAMPRLFSTKKQRSAAFRKVIAEALISKITILAQNLNQNPDQNTNELINNIYQLALITNKDVIAIGKAFSIPANIMQKLKNFKPNSATQAKALRSDLVKQVKKGVTKDKDFSTCITDMKANFDNIKVSINDDNIIEQKHESPDNTYAKYCTVELAQHLLNKIQKDPNDDESIQLLSLISDKSEDEIRRDFVNAADNDAKRPAQPS